MREHFVETSACPPFAARVRFFFFYVDNRMKCGDKALTGQGMKTVDVMCEALFSPKNDTI